MAMPAIPLMPGVKTKHYPIVMPAELGVRLTKLVVGQGGWQSLIVDLQDHIENGGHDDYTMDLPESLMHRMIPYAVKFGSGGYQTMIRWVLCLVLEQHRDSLLGEMQTLKGKNGGGK